MRKILAVLFTIITVIGCFNACTGKANSDKEEKEIDRTEYKTVAAGFCEAVYKNNDTDKALLYFNKSILKAYAEMTGANEKEIKRKLQDTVNEVKETLTAEEIKKSAVSVKKENISSYREYTANEVASANENLKDCGYRGNALTELIALAVRIEIDALEDPTVRLVLGKVDNNWYVIEYYF